MVWRKRNIFWQILLPLWWKTVNDLLLSCRRNVTAEKQPAMTHNNQIQLVMGQVSHLATHRLEMVDGDGAWARSTVRTKVTQPSHANSWISFSSITTNSHWSMGTLATSSCPRATPACTISAAVGSSCTGSSLSLSLGWSRLLSTSGRPWLSATSGGMRLGVLLQNHLGLQ